MDIQELHTEWSKLFQAEHNLNLQRGKLLQQFHRAFKQELEWPNNWYRFLNGANISRAKAERLMRVASFYQEELPL